MHYVLLFAMHVLQLNQFCASSHSLDLRDVGEELAIPLPLLRIEVFFLAACAWCSACLLL
jgi:hypothetical protein